MRPPAPFGTFAVTAAFWTWCVLLSYPLMTSSINLNQAYSEDMLAANESGLMIVCQIAGLAVFMIAGLTAYYSRIFLALGRLSYTSLAILAIFYLSLAVQLHGEELHTLMGILYTCLLIATSILLSTLWTMPPDEFERCVTGASVILCSFGISAIAVLGLPNGRSVGNIHPNLFASPLLVAFIFSQFRPGWLGIVIRILCLIMVASVSSRYALIGCIVALMVHELTFDPLGPVKIPVTAVGLIFAGAFWSQIIDVLALDDPTRNFSSGFSGRGDLWELSLAAIADHPLGVGFKHVSDLALAGHNGYLKILLEFGVIGGGLIIFFIASIILLAGIEAVAPIRRKSRLHRFACARFGGLIGLSFSAFFQPQLLSLGDALPLSFLFLLFRPLSISRPDQIDAPAMVDAL